MSKKTKKPGYVSEWLCMAIDKAVCEFSMSFSHSFTEEEQEEIVLMAADEARAEFIKQKDNLS